MVKLTDDQVDYILDDIKANGVVLEDLQHNLLDHICCIIENEMLESENFYSFYKNVLPRFFHKELKEIQEETEKLLIFKNYYAMKNTLKIAGITSSILTIIGATFKTFHLPGAGIIIVLGALIFSLIFLPLMIALKFKDEEKKIDKWVFSFGFLLAMAITIGVLFKIMHWPFANILMLSGLTSFIFIYVPIYYFSRIRRAELKFNTTVNSVLMMACGGLLYALYNLGYSTKVNDSVARNYTFMKDKQSEIMYANSKIVASIKNDSLLKIHQSTTEIVELIDNIKINLLTKIEGVSVEKAKTINVTDVVHYNDLNFVEHDFVQIKGELSLENLSNKIKVYNELMSLYYPEKTEKIVNLEQFNLKQSIISILLQSFAQIQLQIVNNENSLLN
jgi:hypothetical protein